MTPYAQLSLDDLVATIAAKVKAGDIVSISISTACFKALLDAGHIKGFGEESAGTFCGVPVVLTPDIALFKVTDFGDESEAIH